MKQSKMTGGAAFRSDAGLDLLAVLDCAALPAAVTAPMPTEAEVQVALDNVHPTFGLSLGVLQMVRAIRITADRLEVDFGVGRHVCSNSVRNKPYSSRSQRRPPQ